MAQTADILQAEVEFLQAETQRLLDAALPGQPPVLSWVTPEDCLGAINRHCLRGASIAIQRRAMRQFLAQTLDLSPNYLQVEKGVALVSAPNGSRTDPFKRQWIAAVQDPWIIICPASSCSYATGLG